MKSTRTEPTTTYCEHASRFAPTQLAGLGILDSLASTWLYQIPLVPVQVVKHSHRPVVFCLRLSDDFDSFGVVRIEATPEVVCVQEEEDLPQNANASS